MLQFNNHTLICILVGTLNKGIIVHAFKHTNDSDYKHIFQNMKDFSPSVFTDSNLEGIERARAGGYAFIIPSTIGETTCLFQALQTAISF